MVYLARLNHQNEIHLDLDLLRVFLPVAPGSIVRYGCSCYWPASVLLLFAASTKKIFLLVVL